MAEEIDVTECPDCNQKGRYDGRVLIDGRGVYTCPEGHRWQDADEKPSTKGAAILPTVEASSCSTCGATARTENAYCSNGFHYAGTR